MAKVILWLFLALSVLSTVYSWPSKLSRNRKDESKRQGYYYNLCLYDEYECMDGSGCAKYCDGNSECMDGEDEKWCGCPDPMDSHCNDGVSCYSYEQMCDGNPNCPDGSDEQYCGCPDPMDSYCNDGVSCYSYEEYCDGNQNCPDGSDEQYCGCSDPSDYQCNDGVECYKPDQYCNAIQDCSDGSDEMWCPCTDPLKDFSCYDGFQCAVYCDGTPECKDGEDEMYCDNTYYSTTPSYWNGNNGVGSNCGYGSVKECINGNCVDVYDICNGYDSCSSMENEWFCKDYHDTYYYLRKKMTTRNLSDKVDEKMLRVKAYDLTRSRHGNKNKRQRIQQRILQRKAVAKGRQQQKKSDNLKQLLAAVLRRKLAGRKNYNRN